MPARARRSKKAPRKDRTDQRSMTRQPGGSRDRHWSRWAPQHVEARGGTDANCHRSKTERTTPKNGALLKRVLSQPRQDAEHQLGTGAPQYSSRSVWTTFLEQTRRRLHEENSTCDGADKSCDGMQNGWLGSAFMLHDHAPQTTRTLLVQFDGSYKPRTQRGGAGTAAFLVEHNRML